MVHPSNLDGLVPDSSAVVPLRAPLPEVVYVELADYCNLNCVFCGRESEIKLLRGGDIGGFADLTKVKMLERPLRAAKYLGLSGRIGEPLLYPHLREFLSWVYDINPAIKLRVTTNGLALSRKAAQLLGGHLDFLAISLNASNPNAYARDMRPAGHRAGTDFTPKWQNIIRRISEFILGLPQGDSERIRIIAPLHRDNINDVFDFVRLVASIGCKHAIFTPMHVHEEANLELSVYWFKDKYNDVLDDAAALGAHLGVKVEAARFYSNPKTDVSIDELCHEPSSVAYLNMGSQEKGAPCCQWTETFIPIDVYTDPSAFERFWNSDTYHRLRTKRDFASCKACGLTRTFDEVMFHFTPLLKSKLIASHQIEEAEAASVYPEHDLVRRCRALSLDLPSLRRTVAQVGLQAQRLAVIEKEGLGALPGLDRDCWDAFLGRDISCEPKIDMALGGTFAGIGWFEPDNDPKRKISARWMGGGRWASVFVRVQPGAAYDLRVTAQHVRSHEMSERIGLTACDQVLEVDRSFVDHETVSLRTCVPEALTRRFNGRLRLTMSFSNHPSGETGWVSFSRIEALSAAS